VALLFAPKPGAEFRTDISGITRKGYDGVLDLADTVKAQSADMVDSLKEKTGQLYDFASSKLNRAEIGSESGGVKNLETGDILETNFPTSQKSAAGRGRSSSIL
jgi:gas vesicle protein